MQLQDPELFSAYRKYLRLSQSQLAAEMGTTATSISRWESAKEPITWRTMGHLKALVAVKVHQEMRKAFAQLAPDLQLSRFADLFGIPTSEVIEDRNCNKYVGSITIGGYHDHSFHFSLEDGALHAIGRDRSAVRVTKLFLRKLIEKASRKSG